MKKANYFKALSLCTSDNATRPDLCCIRKETTENGSLFVATDGHILAFIELIGGSEEETDFYAEAHKATGVDLVFLRGAKEYSLIPSQKVRKFLSVDTCMLSDSTYPNWRAVTPSSFTNLQEYKPDFSSHIMARIDKVINCIDKQAIGNCRGWNTKNRLSLFFRDSTINLFAMPITGNMYNTYKIKIPNKI